MRVGIIGTRGYPSYYGGFETAIRRLAPHLVSSGSEVLVYSRPGDTRRDDPDRDPRVETRLTAGIRSKSLSTLSYGLTSSFDAIVRWKPDVVLVMNVANGYWLPMLRRAGIPTVVNVDGIEWERQKWGRGARAVFRTGARLTAKYADELIFDAKAISDYWNRTFKRTGTFIPYGGEAHDTSEPPLGLRRRGYALMVARFVPENSVPQFLEAVPRIAQSYPVVIVGSSGFGDELDERARTLGELDNVTALGHVRDDALLHSLWANSGAYFHGHTVGGTNPALVQAMACGAPTVAIDTIYNREVLGTSAVFTTADPVAIGTAVTDLLQNPDRATALSHDARARAAASYTWEGVCNRYEALLRRAAERSR